MFPPGCLRKPAETMNTQIHPPCPVCGAPIPEGAPQGMCPRCLITAAATAEPRSALPPPDPALLARAFPQLEILEPLGSGGMGSVYKARQLQLDRTIALKILSPELARDPSFAERFTREARALARLNHPNIVHVYDFGEARPAPDAPPFWFLVMEYVDGVNLRQAMRTGGISSAEALVIVPKLCDALHYAHENGVLHRDIKPENILLDAQGRVKIVDFGLALMAGDGVPGATLTLSGTRLGTPHYMAPEQVEKPHDVDHRADIYSLGVVFYELLTGELPLGRFSAPSERAGTDPRLDGVVFRTLEKERDRRYQTAGAMGTAVENISHAGPPPPPPPPASVAGAMPVLPPPPSPRLPRERTSRRAIFGLALQLLAIPLVLAFMVAVRAVDTRVSSVHEQNAIESNEIVRLEQDAFNKNAGAPEKAALEAKAREMRRAAEQRQMEVIREVQSRPASSSWGIVLALPVLPIFTGLLLSWMAVFDIRRANGVLGGSWLAATGAMLLPAVFITGGVCLLFSDTLAKRFLSQDGQFGVETTGFCLGLAGAVIAFLRVRKFADSIPAEPLDPADANSRWLGIISVCLCALGIALVLFRVPTDARNIEALLTWQRITAMFLLINICALVCGYFGWKHPLGRAGAIGSCVMFLGAILLLS